jgi:putative ABC transport system ATP-binding protein
MSGPEGTVEALRFDVPAGRRDTASIIDIPALTLRAGSMTALSGPSGSGKSTLLYLLCGLLPASRGHIVWDGADLASMGEAGRDQWRRENAGFVFQNFHLIDELSPLENVLTPGWFANFSVKPFRDRANALLERFGVPKDRSRTALLSRGEQQRVAIARALLFDPKVIFADEPTASLDSTSGSTVVAVLDALASEGRTVVVATHDPALLAASSRVMKLDHGRLIETDHFELAV